MSLVISVTVNYWHCSLHNTVAFYVNLVYWTSLIFISASRSIMIICLNVLTPPFFHALQIVSVPLFCSLLPSVVVLYTLDSTVLDILTTVKNSFTRSANCFRLQQVLNSYFRKLNHILCCARNYTQPRNIFAKGYMPPLSPPTTKLCTFWLLRCLTLPVQNLYRDLTEIDEISPRSRHDVF